MTCYLGLDGNDFILNGKLQDVNAEEIYGPLTIPVFGSDVVYDCPNSKLMEQKKFVKFGLTQQALESHVPLIEKEVVDYIKMNPAWKGTSGIVDISGAMSEITLFTAARSLQGKEVRQKLTAEFAELYHDLDGVSVALPFNLDAHVNNFCSSGLYSRQLPLPLAAPATELSSRCRQRQDASRLHGAHQPTPQRRPQSRC